MLEPILFYYVCFIVYLLQTKYWGWYPISSNQSIEPLKLIQLTGLVKQTSMNIKMKGRQIFNRNSLLPKFLEQWTMIEIFWMIWIIIAVKKDQKSDEWFDYLDDNKRCMEVERIWAVRTPI